MSDEEPINGASVALVPADAGEPEATESPEEPEARRHWWRRVGAVAVVLVASLAVVVLSPRTAHEPSAPAPTAGQLNPTDLAFLQLMIALDNSALPLLDLMKDVPAVQAVAGPVAEGHRSELVALRAALTAGGGLEDPAQHAGHDLPGMVLDEDLNAVRSAPADQRAAKAVAVLREHLTGTVALATSEGKAGADPATMAAARQVADAHGRILASLPTV